MTHHLYRDYSLRSEVPRNFLSLCEINAICSLVSSQANSTNPSSPSSAESPKAHQRGVLLFCSAPAQWLLWQEVLWTEMLEAPSGKATAQLQEGSRWLRLARRGIKTKPHNMTVRGNVPCHGNVQLLPFGGTDAAVRRRFTAASHTDATFGLR